MAESKLEQMKEQAEQVRPMSWDTYPPPPNNPPTTPPNNPPYYDTNGA